MYLNLLESFLVWDKDLFHTANIMTADDLATQGAGPSAVMILT